MEVKAGRILAQTAVTREKSHPEAQPLRQPVEMALLLPRGNHRWAWGLAHCMVFVSHALYCWCPGTCLAVIPRDSRHSWNVAVPVVPCEGTRCIPPAFPFPTLWPVWGLLQKKMLWWVGKAVRSWDRSRDVIAAGMSFPPCLSELEDSQQVCPLPAPARRGQPPQAMSKQVKRHPEVCNGCPGVFWVGAEQGALHRWVLGEQQHPGVLPVRCVLTCHRGSVVPLNAGRRSREAVSFCPFRID